MNDLIKWIEEGIAPPPSTNYSFDVHSALQLPIDASERKGIQPTVQLKVNGKKYLQAKVDQLIEFYGEAEAPPNTGYFIMVEWDFDGTGSFAYHKELSGTDNKIKTTISHKYAQPGTFFVTFRVVLDRNGDKNDIIHHIINQSRVRIVVT
jgi:hypothetical protein